MGVLLYADDEIFTSEMPENELFNLLVEVKPVLGVSSIEKAEEALISIGSFDAIILDWDFGEDEALDIAEEMEGVKIVKPSTKEAETFEFLMKNNLYCLVYIFSSNDIESQGYGEKLKAKYGNRIKFLQKENFKSKEEILVTKNEILAEIENWKTENVGLALPIKWGQTINQSLQKVFSELAEAEESWIKEIYDTVNTDGLDGKVFLVELLQMVLSEQILTDSSLLSKIKEVVGSAKKTEDDLSVAKLFSRLFYSKLGENSPIMTGDICQIDENVYGVIITPECDIKTVIRNEDLYFDVLPFSSELFNGEILKKYNNYTRGNYNDWKDGSANEKKKVSALKRLFNQSEAKIHFLPSFPLLSADLNQTGLIDFSKNTIRLNNDQVTNSRIYKLNSPFIQQLRQRHLAYIGRVGVPAMPSALKNWNLG